MVAAMNVVFLGATKGMGRALARLMAERGDRLFLLGRSEDDLRATVADLELRGAGNVSYALCDLETPESFPPALDAATAFLGTLESVVVTAGMFATQDELEADPSLAERLTRINFTNTVVFCEHAQQRLLAEGGGTRCVFGAVARGRRRKQVAS